MWPAGNKRAPHYAFCAWLIDLLPQQMALFPLERSKNPFSLRLRQYSHLCAESRHAMNLVRIKIHPHKNPMNVLFLHA